MGRNACLICGCFFAQKRSNCQFTVYICLLLVVTINVGGKVERTFAMMLTRKELSVRHSSAFRTFYASKTTFGISKKAPF